jgi:hypothetical protein
VASYLNVAMVVLAILNGSLLWWVSQEHLVPFKYHVPFGLLRMHLLPEKVWESCIVMICVSLQAEVSQCPMSDSVSHE